MFNFRKEKDPQYLYKQFYFSLEKLSNIAVLKTKKSDVRTVLKILNDFGNVFNRIWRLKKEKPRKFEWLFYAEDYMQNEILAPKKPSPTGVSSNVEAEGVRTIQSVEEELLESSSLKKLRGLNEFFLIYEKILLAAYECDEPEISMRASYQLILMLKKLIREKSHEFTIGYLLDCLNTTYEKSLKILKEKDDYDPSINFVSYYWYVSVVFDYMEKKISYDVFEYLEVLDSHLTKALKITIDNDMIGVFNSLISSISTAIITPTHYSDELIQYANAVFRANSEDWNVLINLRKQEDRLYTLQDMKDWLDRFQKNKIKNENISFSNRESLESLEFEITWHVIEKFKFRNLQKILFKMGSYCLYKEKKYFLQSIFEYQQPADSEVMWTDSKVYPDNLKDILNLFYSQGIHNNLFETWDWRISPRVYYKKYLVLLIDRLVKQKRNISIETEISDMNVNMLAAIADHDCDEWISLWEALYQTLERMGSQRLVKPIEGHSWNETISFLNNLKVAAVEKIKDIRQTNVASPIKIQEFKVSVEKSYAKYSTLNKIYKRSENIKDVTADEKVDEFVFVAINLINSKEPFIDDWYIRFGDYGASFGRDIARIENSYILKNLIDKSKTTKIKKGLENVVSKFEGPIIFLINVGYYQFMQSHKLNNYFLNKRDDDDENLIGQLEVNNFKIPIYEFWDEKLTRETLVLDEKHMGVLLRKEKLSINVQDFVRDQKLIDELLINPAEWLKNLEPLEKQEKYLKERVWIKILERIKLQTDDSFSAIKISTDELLDPLEK